MKTVIEMAREAGLVADANNSGFDSVVAFAELVRADERARMAEQPAPVQEFDIRGMLASKLTCWHRLRGAEENELVELVAGLLQPAQQEPVALPCCGYTDASAVKWNPYNQVVQCHNCGQVYATPQQPAQQQEPDAIVTSLTSFPDGVPRSGLDRELPLMAGVYLTPQPAQRKQLTTQEIRELWAGENGLEDCNMSKLDDFEKVVRAVEAKHVIKDTP